MKSEEYKFCTHCGAKMPKDIKFCTSCGKAFKSATTPMDITDDAVDKGIEQKEKQDKKSSIKPKKTKKGLLMSIVGIIVLIVLILYFIGSGSVTETTTDLYPACLSVKDTKEFLEKNNLKNYGESLYGNEESEIGIILDEEGFISEAQIRDGNWSLNGIKIGDIFEPDTVGRKLTDIGMSFLGEMESEAGERYIEYMSFTPTEHTRDVQLYLDENDAIYSINFTYLDEETAKEKLAEDPLYELIQGNEAVSETVEFEPEMELETDEESIAETEMFFDESEYMLPYSNVQYLTEKDVAELSNDEIRIAINEIYARHGRAFQTEDLNEYFSSKSWYEPKYSAEEFSEIEDSVLNDYEKKNIEILAAVRDGNDTAGGTFEENWMYGSYYLDLGEGGITAEIGYYTDTGVGYISLSGSYRDSVGEFTGTITYMDDGSMLASNEYDETAIFEYNGIDQIEIVFADNTGGMDFPGFEGIYQKTEDLPR